MITLVISGLHLCEDHKLINEMGQKEHEFLTLNSLKEMWLGRCGEQDHWSDAEL